MTDESDIDVAVIVHPYIEKMHDEMIDASVDLELEYDRVLSVLLIDHDNFKSWENILPVYKNVRKDVVVLWKAA